MQENDAPGKLKARTFDVYLGMATVVHDEHSRAKKRDTAQYCNARR